MIGSHVADKSPFELTTRYTDHTVASQNECTTCEQNTGHSPSLYTHCTYFTSRSRKIGSGSTGYRKLEVRTVKLEVRTEKLEMRTGKFEVRTEKLEVRTEKIGSA